MNASVRIHRGFFIPTMGLIAFIVSIMYRYVTVQKAYMIFTIVLPVMIIARLILSSKASIRLRDFHGVGIKVLIFTLFYLLIYAVLGHEIGFFFKYYLFPFELLFYLFVAYAHEGKTYLNRTLGQIVVFLNVLSVLDLYQVFFHRPILERWLLTDSTYSYNFGASTFRVISAFGHPIVAGLMFVALFLLNLRMLRGGAKYALELICLVNIFATSSRSSWIALVVCLGLMLLNFFRHHAHVPQAVSLRRVIIGIIVFIFGIAVVGVFSGRLITLFNKVMLRFGDSLSVNSTSISNLQRTGTIHAIMDNQLHGGLRHLIFGHGIDSATQFMLSHTIAIEGFTTTDNQYLSCFYEFGLLGILLLIIVGVDLVLKYYRNPGKLASLVMLPLFAIAMEIFFFEIHSWIPVIVIIVILYACAEFSLNDELME